VGLGYDIHPFQLGRELYLCGIKIEHTHGLLGHSDADAPLHAIIDAILGAAGEPDIGEIFPNTDGRYKNIDSKLLLSQVWQRVKEKGWQIVNLDLVIIAEAPKLSPYKEEMRMQVAKLLEITSENVGIKATTCEGLGAIGRKEGLSAQVVVLMNRVS
jgi:2-C-methyl-D-erythritol 2,4-cyclodiphosphate synthase